MDSHNMVSDPTTKGFRATLGVPQEPVPPRGVVNTNLYEINLSTARLYRRLLLLFMYVVRTAMSTGGSAAVIHEVMTAV